MPRSVAAATSILSTPIPARPITLSASAAAMRSAVTLVAERTASPSYPAMRRRSSAAPRPVSTSASIPRTVNISTARGLKSSVINTFGIYRSEINPGGTEDTELFFTVIPAKAGIHLSTVRAPAGMDPGLRRDDVFSGSSCLRGENRTCRQAHATLAPSRSSAQAQSSQGRRASTSLRSTVAPAQMRMPGGEARWLARS